MIQDNAILSSSTKDEFLKMLEEKESNTKRYLPTGKTVRFRSLTAKDMVGGINKEAAADTIEYTGIVVEFPDENGKTLSYCLGESAWISIKGRIRIFGDGFDELSLDTKLPAINERFQRIDDPVTVVVSYDKVRAIMSNQYKVIPAKDVFESVFAISEQRLGDMEFLTGNITHDRFASLVLFPTKGAALCETYNMPQGIVPGMSIETSDTGYSANRIIPRWIVSSANGCKRAISLPNESIEMPHIGAANTMENLEQMLPTLFTKFNNTIERLCELLTIDIMDPVQVIFDVCEKYKIGKRYAKMAAEGIDLNIPWTAYDVIIVLSGISSMVENPLDMELKVGQALWYNF